MLPEGGILVRILFFRVLIFAFCCCEWGKRPEMESKKSLFSECGFYNQMRGLKYGGLKIGAKQMGGRWEYRCLPTV